MKNSTIAIVIRAAQQRLEEFREVPEKPLPEFLTDDGMRALIETFRDERKKWKTSL